MSPEIPLDTAYSPSSTGRVTTVNIKSRYTTVLIKKVNFFQEKKIFELIWIFYGFFYRSQKLLRKYLYENIVLVVCWNNWRYSSPCWYYKQDRGSSDDWQGKGTLIMITLTLHSIYWKFCFIYLFWNALHISFNFMCYCFTYMSKYL